MTQENIIAVQPGEIAAKALAIKAEGYRLVQISCTDDGGYDIIYSFDKEGALVLLRLHTAYDTEVPSISSIYFPAFLYENEMKDLFGVKISNIVVDYGGNFYKLQKKTPFHTPQAEDAGDGNRG